MLARRSHGLGQTCKHDCGSSLHVFPSNMKIYHVVFYTIFLLALAFPFVPFITLGGTHKCSTVKVGLTGSRCALNIFLSQSPVTPLYAEPRVGFKQAELAIV